LRHSRFTVIVDGARFIVVVEQELRAMKSRLVCFLFLLLFASLTKLSFPQASPTQNGEVTTIRGTFSNAPIGTCSVELRGEYNGQTVARQFCAQDVFTFVGVPRGEYVVAMECGTKETEQRVSAESEESDVELDLARPQKSKPMSDGSVSVSELQVPEKAQRLLVRANEEMATAKVESAEKDIRKALEIAPNFAKAVAFEAVIKLTSGDGTAALTLADRAVQMDGQLPYAEFVRAMVLNNQGRFTEAQAAANEGLRSDGQSWQGHFELAQALYGSSDRAGALVEATRAENAAPAAFAPVRILRAILLVKMNFLDAARQELKNIDKLGISDARTVELHQVLSLKNH
jgi:tetratricopeptide (TPR) repeat protein